MGFALTTDEKNHVPALHLHSSAQQLNSYVIQNHKNVKREKKLIEKLEKKVSTKKNKDLLEGLGIKSKKVSEPKVNGSASILNAARLIKFTAVGDEYTRTDLSKDLFIPTNVITEILMFLNKRSPLSVRVKSRTAQLFTMNKTDMVSISLSYPQIFEKICKRGAFNQKQLEILILKTKYLFYMNNKKQFIGDDFIYKNDDEDKFSHYYINTLDEEEMKRRPFSFM